MKRISVILALFALVSAWAPHPHANSATGAHAGHAANHSQDVDRPLTVASDDAHHEHSTTTQLETATCPVCRSSSDREGDPGSAALVIVVAQDALRAVANAGPRIPNASAIGLPPTRAPPIG